MDLKILDIQILAKALSFRIQILPKSKYRLLYLNRGFGYQGDLSGCHAYLQGWEESRKVHSTGNYNTVNS